VRKTPGKLATAPMILNRQRRVRVSVTELGKFLSRARCAIRLPGESFTVCFVSNAEIARWNRAYRGKSGATDVLSFPARAEQKSMRRTSSPKTRGNSPVPFPVRADSYIGDIAIAPSVARRNARKFGRTFEDELRILILHGMLHLIGYDHETDTGQMDRRERRLRRALGLA
jgi:probable rRNA maturation factor